MTTCATGDDGDVLEHALAAVTEARRLDGDGGERAAQLVDDEGRERLALEVLGDDEQLLAGLHDLLEHGQQVLDVADLLFAIRISGSLRTASMRSGSVIMYGET